MESWHSTYDALQIGGTGTVWSSNNEAISDSIYLSQNVYYDGDWKRIVTDGTSSYLLINGGHRWYGDPSGTDYSTK